MLRGWPGYHVWRRQRLFLFSFVLFSLFPLSLHAQNDAAFISQSVPRTLQPGETASVSVTMQNIGTTTWDPAADYSLGSQNPENNWTWGLARVPLDSPVAPGQRKTLRFTITAPSAPGTYDFQWQMVQEYVEWFGDYSANVAITVVAPTNGARFVSQSAPDRLLPGERATVSVTMQNTGTTTWRPADEYYLGSQNPENNFTWGLARVPLAGPVPPGQQVTFTFSITAPSIPGVYGFQWRMVQEYVEWFGDASPNLPLPVVSPTNGARFVSQSAPARMLPGDTATVSITMENTGTSTWRPADEYYLGSQNPENNWTWGLARVTLPSPVVPGQRATFSFAITAPSAAGTYGFQWQMVQEYVEFFGDRSPNLPITVTGPTNGARFVSQSVPTRMLPGDRATVSIIMENTGTSTWDSAANYLLGSQNPENNWTWGLARVPAAGPVAPGQQGTFTFTITAPTPLGTYNFQWQMVQEYVEFFGDRTPNLPITVAGPTNGARFVSQSAPTRMLPGDTATVSIVMENTGTSTWDGAADYFLGSQNPENNWTWDVARVAPDAPVAPGQQGTFNFTITAPTTLGTYDFQWQMVQEHVEWFGDRSPNLAIAVAGPTNDARFVAQSVPTVMLPGDTATVSVTLENTGSTTWDSAADYFLGSQNPENNWTWGVARVAPDSPVSPGQQATFSFEITAPSTPGTYNFQWQMVQEYVEWFGERTPNVAIQTGSTDDNADMVSNTIPTGMVSGMSYPVRVTVLNTGVSTWSRDGDGPPDGSQGFKLVAIDGDLIPVGVRYSLPPGVEVPPGESFAFEFTIVAPFFELVTTSLQMIHEGVGLFGEVLFVSVEVQQVDLPLSTISVDPVSGSPGTLVAVNLVEGNAFHRFSEVAFSFGDPDAHYYARVPVRTTWVNDSQLTFTVPPEAGCGIYYVSVFAPAAPEVRVSKSARFTLTAPCDPERRNKLDLFTYNVHLLPTAGHMDYRAGLIAYHPELRGHDVVVLVEAMSDSHRQTITYALQPEYPYQSRILGRDHGLVQDGGVIILSKWPIEAEAQTLFGDLCTGIDCYGDKGVNYVRINKAGQRYHAFGTHLDSGWDYDDIGVRLWQLRIMSQFIKGRRIPNDDPVLMAGDFNVDRNRANGEYERMLQVLSASQPLIYGLRYSTNPKGEWLDYVLYSHAHLQPESSFNWVRTPRDGRGDDLSDHYAVLGGFVFSLPADLAAACSAPPAEAPLGDTPSGTLGTPMPTFTWNEVPEANSYTLSVMRASDGATLLRRRRIAETSLTVDTPLPSRVDLRWRVQGENSCGTGPESSEVSFEVNHEADTPPTEAPLPNWPGGTVSNPRPAFSWSPVEGASSYSLYLQTAADEAPILQQTGISGTSFVPEWALPADLELQWQVLGESPWGPGPSSPSVAFLVHGVERNQPPLARVTHDGGCSAGCSVTFTVSAEDPDGDPLNIAWSGCAEGTSPAVTCTLSSAGSLTASVTVTDERGGSISVTDSATVYASSYGVGSWGSCSGSGDFVCTSIAADGCSRPGTQTRSVAEDSWTLDPSQAVPAPPASQSCTETARGYVKGFP